MSLLDCVPAGFSLEVCGPGAASLTRCSRAAVRGVSDCGRLLPTGGIELPSLILRSSIDEARESMVAPLSREERAASALALCPS